MDRSHLTSVQSARVIVLIEAEYVSSGKNDREFAAYASEKLGFPVNERQLHNRRIELGIPARRDIIKPEVDVPIRLASIEAQLISDQKEFRGLASLFLDLRDRVALIEKALRLKGHFEGFPS